MGDDVFLTHLSPQLSVVDRGVLHMTSRQLRTATAEYARHTPVTPGDNEMLPPALERMSINDRTDFCRALIGDPGNDDKAYCRFCDRIHILDGVQPGPTWKFDDTNWMDHRQILGEEMTFTLEDSELTFTGLTYYPYMDPYWRSPGPFPQVPSLNEQEFLRQLGRAPQRAKPRRCASTALSAYTFTTSRMFTLLNKIENLGQDNGLSQAEKQAQQAPLQAEYDMLLISMRGLSWSCSKNPLDYIHQDQKVWTATDSDRVSYIRIDTTFRARDMRLFSSGMYRIPICFHAAVRLQFQDQRTDPRTGVNFGINDQFDLTVAQPLRHRFEFDIPLGKDTYNVDIWVPNDTLDLFWNCGMELNNIPDRLFLEGYTEGVSTKPPSMDLLQQCHRCDHCNIDFKLKFSRNSLRGDQVVKISRWWQKPFMLGNQRPSIFANTRIGISARDVRNSSGLGTREEMLGS